MEDMSENLESVQVNSKKLINGPIKVWIVLLSLPIILLDPQSQLIALIAFTILSIHASKYFFKIFAIPATFIVLSMVVILFTIEGKEIFSFHFLKITDKGLETALSTLLRAFSTLSAFCYLILTTTLPEFLESVKVKGFLREVMLLSYRAIQILLDEIESLRISADARLGLFGLRRIIKTTSILAYMLFLRSFEKIEKFERAKESRNYSGIFPVLRFENKRSVFALILFGLVVAGLLI